jgi:hypothetical protein
MDASDSYLKQFFNSQTLYDADCPSLPAYWRHDLVSETDPLMMCRHIKLPME